MARKQPAYKSIEPSLWHRHGIVCMVLGGLLILTLALSQAALAQSKPQSPPNIQRANLKNQSRNLNHFIPIMFLPGGVKSSNFLVDIENLLYTIENQNLDIAISESRIKDAKGNMIRSIAPFMPSIVGEYSYENYDGGQVFVDERPVLVKRTTHLPKASLSYDIPLGGRPIFQLKASRSEFHRAQLRRDRIYQSSLFEGLKAYFNLLHNYSKLTVTEQSLEEARMDRALTQRKFELGFVKKLDVMERQGIEADKKSQVLESKNQVNLSKLKIATLLNVPLTWEIQLKQKTIQPFSLLKKNTTLEGYLQTAHTQRPDIQEMDREIKEAKLAYKMIRSDILPSLNLSSYIGGVGSVPGNLNQIKQYGGKMFVNVFKNMGVETWGNLKSAKAKIQEAILIKQRKLNDIYQTISEDYYNTQMYQEQMKVMTQKRGATQEAYRIAHLRKQAGMGTTLEMTQLETAMIQAKMDYSSSVLNYNISQSKLLYETGQLTTDTILERLNTTTGSRLPQQQKAESQKQVAAVTISTQESEEVNKEKSTQIYRALQIESLEISE